MNLTAKIRLLGDKNSVITKTRTFEHKGKNVIVYEVQTTSPLSEGPVKNIHKWRYLIDNKEKQDCSLDYDSMEEAIRNYVKNSNDNLMEQKLRKMIRNIIKEEIFHEKLKRNNKQK